MFIPSYMVIIYLKIFPPTWLLPPTCLFQTVEYIIFTKFHEDQTKIADFLVMLQIGSSYFLVKW